VGDVGVGGEHKRSEDCGRGGRGGALRGELFRSRFDGYDRVGDGFEVVGR
jgi:hypothetical protein